MTLDAGTFVLTVLSPYAVTHVSYVHKDLHPRLVAIRFPQTVLNKQTLQIRAAWI